MNKRYPFSMSTPLIFSPEPPKAQVEPAYWFAFRKDKLLIQNKGSSMRIPFVQDLTALSLQFECRRYLGLYNGTNCYVAELFEDVSIPDTMILLGLRNLFGHVHDDLVTIAGRAIQILHWHKAHQYCGRCAGKMVDKTGELAKECSECAFICYPRLSPAVIMAIRRGHEILLARSSRFPNGMYSTLAGFVEPGETLEEAVIREVKEEVNIQIKEIQYFASQPWPFPHSLMIGFTAVFAGGEIGLDTSEIEDAKWFSKENLPKIPSKRTISRALIDDFLESL